MRLRTKRLPWPVLLLLGLPLAAGVAWVVVWLAFSSVVESRLERLLEQRFAADVHFGSLSYLPPYWVEADDVVLSSEYGGERVEWIRVPSMRGRLNRIPGTGRLAIEKLTLSAPRVVVVHDADGVHEASDLWRRGQRKRRGKLSLRRIEARAIELEVRSATAKGARAKPLVLSGLDLHLEADTGGKRSYDYAIDGDTPPLKIDSKGNLDVDRRLVRVDALDADVVLGSGDPADAVATLPVEVRGAKGRIELPVQRWRVDTANVSAGRQTKIALEDLGGTATFSRGRVDVPDLEASAYGGRLRSKLGVETGDTLRWQGTFAVSALDLAALGHAFSKGASITGEMSGEARLSGRLAAGNVLDSLRGDGELHASGGRFYEIPLVAELLDAIQLGKDAATVSNAAAEFRVGERKAHLDSAALGSPTIGMHGHGDVGFDGRLALEMVIVPLGDLKEKLVGSDVPVIGDAIAAVVGAVQSLFASASALVYQFHVVGTLRDPEVTPVPVPVLTRDAATVFGRMVRQGWDSDVLAENEDS